MNYGAAVKKIRKARGFTQKSLAEETGLDQSYISMLERNQRSPSSLAIEVISKATKFPVYFIMFLASDEEDLFGISKQDADALAQALFNFTLEVTKDTNS